MPTYEYECTRCGLITEEFKSISAPKRQRCPECRGKVLRLISGSMGVHFKGAGFYVTDSQGKMSGGDKDKAALADSSDNKTGEKPK